MDSRDPLEALVISVFSELVASGGLPRSMFEDIAKAHYRMADETLLEDKRESAMATADLATIVAKLSRTAKVTPGLRLVHDADAPQQPDT